LIWWGRECSHDGFDFVFSTMGRPVELGFGAEFFFFLDMVEPFGVGHGGAWGDHADPLAVGGLGEVDGDTQAAGEGGEAGDVVVMLVGDEDGVQGGGVFVGDGHALEEFTAGEAGVDEQAGVGGGDDRGVALGAGGEDGHAHGLEDTPRGCGLGG